MRLGNTAKQWGKNDSPQKELLHIAHGAVFIALAFSLQHFAFADRL